MGQWPAVAAGPGPRLVQRAAWGPPCARGGRGDPRGGQQEETGRMDASGGVGDMA